MIDDEAREAARWLAAAESAHSYVCGLCEGLIVRCESDELRGQLTESVDEASRQHAIATARMRRALLGEASGDGE